MTRRGVQSLDPALDTALASLPRDMRDRLNMLRLRLLLSPDVKRYLNREIEPPTKKELEALNELERVLRSAESEG